MGTALDTSTLVQQQRDDEWRAYGRNEPILMEYYRSFSNHSVDVRVLDVVQRSSNTSISDEKRFHTSVDLLDHLYPPLAEDVKFRLIACNQLSSDAFKVIGSLYNIHFGFWNWVLSDEAADGYWMHSHASGTILCFDLACIEDYVATKEAPTALVYGGRFKQLSSIHSFSDTTGVHDASNRQSIHTNRRATGYLTKRHDTPIFIYFNECVADMDLGSSQISPLPQIVNIRDFIPPTSVQGIMIHLKSLPQNSLKELVEDPFAIVTLVEGKVIQSWFSFFLKVARELESTDALITLTTPDEILFKKASYIRRDFLLALDRFYRQFEAHKGFLMYVVDGTKPSWSPKVVHQELKDQIKSFDVLMLRIDQLKERANGILQLIFNNINIRQARLSIAQADRTMDMASLQRFDTYLSYQQGESMRRISILATIFLPLSLTTGFLGMNAKEINHGAWDLWIFAPIAGVSSIVTFLTAYIMGRRSTSKLKVDMEEAEGGRRLRFDSLPTIADALLRDPGGGGPMLRAREKSP